MLNKSKFIEYELTFLIRLYYIKVYYMEEDKTIKRKKIFNITIKVIAYTIISNSMEPTIKVYDVVFVIKKDFNKLKEGDIITFYSTNPIYGGRPITHRIVSKNENGSLTVKGDSNEREDSEYIYSENVIGKVAVIIPEFGKLQFFIASKKGWVVAILIPAVWIIGYDIYKLVKLIIFKIRLKKVANKHGNI